MYTDEQLEDIAKFGVELLLKFPDMTVERTLELCIDYALIMYGDPTSDEKPRGVMIA